MTGQELLLTPVTRFYIVSEFVIYPKKGAAARKGSKGKTSAKELEDKLASVAANAASKTGTNGVIPSISTAPSGTDTPDSPTGAPGSPTLDNGDIDTVKRAAALRARAVRPDGGVVCCLAVFEYCFKIGRVTIPPVSLRTDHLHTQILMRRSVSPSITLCSPRPRKAGRTHESSSFRRTTVPSGFVAGGKTS